MTKYFTAAEMKQFHIINFPEISFEFFIEKYIELYLLEHNEFSQVVVISATGFQIPFKRKK